VIDSKFSVESFREVKINAELSSDLHKQLEADIAKRINTVVEKELINIASQLNELGHCLEVAKPEYDGTNSTFEYELNDFTNTEKPRVHFDTQVCVLSGYQIGVD